MSETIDISPLTDMLEEISGPRVGREVLVDETVALTQPIVAAPTKLPFGFPDHYLNCMGGNRDLYDILEGYAKAKRDERTHVMMEQAEALFEAVYAHTTHGFKDKIDRILGGNRRYEVTIRCEFAFESNVDKDEFTFAEDIQALLSDALGHQYDRPWFDVEVIEVEVE